jgi:ubiquinone biosynthesis protein
VLTMEYIEGIKITDIEQLKAHHLDLVAISEIGYRLFMTQILSFGLFHADPHAGNLIVTKKQRLVFIDFGAVGRVPKSDRPLFERLILNFLAKRADKIVKLLKEMAIHYVIDDDKQFESDVNELFGMVHSSSLKEIKVVDVMNKMKEVLKNNRLVMPEYFYLLFKGVSLLDGVGRQLNPDLDVVKSLKPFTKKIMQERLSPDHLKEKGIEKMADLYEDVEQVPIALKSVLAKLNQNDLGLNVKLKQLTEVDSLVKSSVINLILGLVLTGHIIASALLYTAGYPWLSVVTVLVSLLLIIVLFLRVLRR